MVANLSVGADGVPMIMIMMSEVLRVLFGLCYRRSNDVSRPGSCIVSSQGKLYILEKPKPSEGDLRIFEIHLPWHETTMPGFITSITFPLPKVITVCPLDKIHEPFRLVECDTKILLVGFFREATEGERPT
jgi:hypothetical protein